MKNPKMHFFYKIRWCVLFSIIFVSFSLCSTPYQKLFKKCEQVPRSSIEGIDGTYVINLDVRPEKWHRVEPLLYYHGIDHCRFPAIFGISFDIPTLKQYCSKHIRPGPLGCMLSHLSIYQDALLRGFEVIWVMEDDITIKRNPKLLTDILRELDQKDPNWDVLYTDLDWVKEDGSKVRALALPLNKKRPFPQSLSYYAYRKNISINLQLIRSRYGTGSMILSKRGMEKILDHFLSYDDISCPIDLEIHYVPGIRQYGIINPIATNGHFTFNYSDTGTGRVNNYYEIDEENIQFLDEISEKVKVNFKDLETWNRFIEE